MNIVDFRITSLSVRPRSRRRRQPGACRRRAPGDLGADPGSAGRPALASCSQLFHPLPAEAEIERVFREECGRKLQGRKVEAVALPCAGRAAATFPADAAVRGSASACGVGLVCQVGEAAAVGVARCGASRRAGLRERPDLHLSDDEFERLFAQADAQGFKAFKIQGRSPRLRARSASPGDPGRRSCAKGALNMIDTNEAWLPKRSIRNLLTMHKGRARHFIGWKIPSCAMTSPA